VHFHVCAELSLNEARHPDSVDGAKWHRHGSQFPGARGLRSYLVSAGAFAQPADLVADERRDFVNDVQAKLLVHPQGRVNRVLSPAALAYFGHR
jgi:hypothetical protein